MLFLADGPLRHSLYSFPHSAMAQTQPSSLDVSWARKLRWIPKSTATLSTVNTLPPASRFDHDNDCEDVEAVQARRYPFSAMYVTFSLALGTSGRIYKEIRTVQQLRQPRNKSGLNLTAYLWAELTLVLNLVLNFRASLDLLMCST